MELSVLGEKRQIKSQNKKSKQKEKTKSQNKKTKKSKRKNKIKSQNKKSSENIEKVGFPRNSSHQPTKNICSNEL